MSCVRDTLSSAQTTPQYTSYGTYRDTLSGPATVRLHTLPYRSYILVLRRPAQCNPSRSRRTRASAPGFGTARQGFRSADGRGSLCSPEYAPLEHLRFHLRQLLVARIRRLDRCRTHLRAVMISTNRAAYLWTALAA
jgi:hypothetical protein